MIHAAWLTVIIPVAVTAGFLISNGFNLCKHHEIETGDCEDMQPIDPVNVVMIRKVRA